MTDTTHPSTGCAGAAAPLGALRRQAGLGLLGVGGGLGLAAWVSTGLAPVAPGCLALLSVAALALATLVLAGLPAHRPHRRFGPANHVTLARAGATLWLALLACEPGALAAHGWVPCIVGVVLLGLDGVDGWLARSTGLASPFGARLDMEVDAVLILVLAALVHASGRTGAWVLAAGLLRYLFVALGLPLRWLRRPLPPSRRRQAVCVVQTGALVACLAPGMAPPLSTGLAGLGLAALVLSFAADTHWLFRRRDGGRG